MSQGVSGFYLHAGANPGIGGSAKQLGYKQNGGKDGGMYKIAGGCSGGNIYHLLGSIDESKRQDYSQDACKTT